MPDMMRDAMPAAMPADEAGPVFREPWEAQAFAIVFRLAEAGHVSWAEWADLLGAEIRAAQRDGDPDLGSTYYRHWLAALERLVLAKGLATPAEMRVRQIEIEAGGRHIHPARRDPVRIA